MDQQINSPDHIVTPDDDPDRKGLSAQETAPAEAKTVWADFWMFLAADGIFLFGMLVVWRLANADIVVPNSDAWAAALAGVFAVTIGLLTATEKAFSFRRMGRAPHTKGFALGLLIFTVIGTLAGPVGAIAAAQDKILLAQVAACLAFPAFVALLALQIVTMIRGKP